MKSMLYVGAALMIGASIYGFVDYKQTSGKKEFTDMYTGEQKQSVTTEKPVTVTEKKSTPGDDNKTTIAADKDEKKTIEKTNTVAKAKPVVKKHKKRKFRYSEFSRAPLRDDVESEEPVTEEKKNDQ